MHWIIVFVCFDMRLPYFSYVYPLVELLRCRLHRWVGTHTYRLRTWRRMWYHIKSYLFYDGLIFLKRCLLCVCVHPPLPIYMSCLSPRLFSVGWSVEKVLYCWWPGKRLIVNQQTVCFVEIMNTCTTFYFFYRHTHTFKSVVSTPCCWAFDIFIYLWWCLFLFFCVVLSHVSSVCCCNAFHKIKKKKKTFVCMRNTSIYPSFTVR